MDEETVVVAKLRDATLVYHGPTIDIFKPYSIHCDRVAFIRDTYEGDSRPTEVREALEVIRQYHSKLFENYDKNKQSKVFDSSKQTIPVDGGLS